MMPRFLEIVTRTFGGRPTMLAENERSVRPLLWDALQVIVKDNQHAGVAAANAALANYTPTCRYVWLLDDDDLCIMPSLVDDLKYLDWRHASPPAIVVRMDHGPLGVLPEKAHWGQAPVQGRIGASALITRQDVWMHCRQAWASGRYEADYDFAAAVWESYGTHIVWHDVVASRVQRISQGQPEAV